MAGRQARRSGIDGPNARHRMLSRWSGRARTKSTEVRVTVTTPEEGNQFLSESNIVELLERYLIVDVRQAKAHRGKPYICMKIEPVPPSSAKVSIVPDVDSKKLVLFEAYMLVWRFNPEIEQWEWEIQSTRHVS
jgi:hypothetical protein